MTTMGIVREGAGEARVAATPKTIARLIDLGFELIIEEGAGLEATFLDSAYEQAGAKVVDSRTAWSAEVVLKVNPPTPDEVKLLADGATLICLLFPAIRPDIRESLEIRESLH